MDLQDGNVNVLVKPLECFGGNDSFIQTQQNDLIKNKYCEENNITLLRIKYDEKINDMLNKNLIESYN